MTDTVTPEDIKTEEEKAKEQIDAAATQAQTAAEQSGASPDEVKKAVEKARTEEKNKLYPQIDALKKEFEKIQTLLEEERAEKEQIKKDATTKAEAERQAKLSETERINEVVSRLEEQLKNERKEREKFKKDLEEKDRKEELRRYKEALIKANEDEIIPELVVGTTEEELDAALQFAKARFKEYAEKFQQRKSDDTRRRMPRSTNPDLEALEELELSKDLTALDTDKYLKDESYRKQIQAELEQEYSRLAGR